MGELSGGGVEVVCRPLPGRWAPEQVLRALRHDDRPFALIGAWADGGGDGTAGRPPSGYRAILGSGPIRSLAPGEGPFAVLDDLPQPVGDRTGGSGNANGNGRGGARALVGGGWVGYLGYQLNRMVERLPPAPEPAPALPPASLAYYDNVLRRGHDGRWWFEALATPGRRPALDARYRHLSRLLGGTAPPPAPHRLSPFRLVPGPDRHRAAVSAALGHIRAGDVYQANVCLRADAELDGDPLDLFCTGVAALRPAYGAFLRLPEGAVCSFSPELFLRARGRHVVTSPIKGTAVRGPDPATAARQRRALEGSAKDRAENVMIVDLMRNDLGRVCRWGTVTVPRLARAEPHPGLWHLVSDVAGELRPGVGAAGLLRATFPPGSCTGAPKVRAMELIGSLEATARGVYTGAVGLAGPLGGLTLNVAIRTLEWAAATGRVSLGAGGGVVAGSDPDAEFRECLAKATPVLTALDGAWEAAARR